MTDAVDNGSVDGAEGGEILESSLQGTTDQIIDPWCDLCYYETGQETDATGFCPECNSFLCHSCIKAHAKMPTLRNHLIRRGARMPACQSEKPVKFPDCTSHVGKVMDQFCFDHGIMKCSQCIEDTHLLCGTGTVLDLCKTIDSEDFLNLMETVRCLHNISVSTKTTLEKNINDNKNKKSQLRKELEGLRDKLIAQVKEHCSDIITKINSVYDHNLSALAEHVELLSDIDHCLDKTLSEIDKKGNAICEPNLFIRMQEIVGHVARCRNELEDIKKHLHTNELSFSPSAEMSAFISGTCQLGELRNESKQTEIMIPQPNIAFPQPLGNTTAQGTKHDISSITASMLGSIDIKLADDQTSCDVYGMDVTKDGNVLLADFKNKKVKAFSPDNKLLSYLILSSSPSDVSILNRLTAAVGTIDGKLQLINISDVNSISVQRTIDLGYRIIGTLKYGTNIAIARWDEHSKVEMLTLNGKQVWSAMGTKGQMIFENPFSVACSTFTNRETIIVTDWGKNTLTLLDATDGQLIKTVDVKGKGPHGITVDIYGNVYVCFFFSKEICVWSANLKQSKILLSRANLKDSPRAISYRSSTNCLFISYCCEDTIECFQLLYN